MIENLIIVESPHKATLIQGFLGKEHYKVVSSKGHIRDLEETGMSIDIENGFAPQYVVSPSKQSLVNALKKDASAVRTVWLASDPDREGEAIAWHLSEVLGLDPASTKRITYNEITKSAVLDSLDHPRSVDMNLVNAQQARRVLDRLVGFELSPVLWRRVRRGLSAGRVQSVTLRLVVDREREIAAFKPSAYYSVGGKFVFNGTRKAAGGLLDVRFNDAAEVRRFLEDCAGAEFKVAGVDKKEGVRVPAAPFTTSTLQQEASRKLHFSSSRTMRVAQSLYEKGLITYMRTDSTNLSSLAINTAKQFICDNFGAEYSRPRNYKTKSKGAQEAHEAIRPTFIANASIQGDADSQKLYDLIWKRTVASQMAEAKVLTTSVNVGIEKRPELFCVQSLQILFDGFLKLYVEGRDDEDNDSLEEVVLPEVHIGDIVKCNSIDATCKFTLAPYRYTEATLIKKMEEIGIGRPSTYAPTVTMLTSTRGYLVTADKEGELVQVTNLSLKDGVITEALKAEKVGADKHKLIPTDTGLAVCDYLVNNFPDVMNYDFTANVEQDFDKIAEGEKVWNEVISEFYAPFHGQVQATLENKDFSHVSREIGVDPSDGLLVVAKFGPYGAYVQKGEGEGRRCANLAKGQLIESITLDEALKLFALPRVVGQHEGFDVVANTGKYGPFLKWNGTNVSIPRGKNPLTISLEECVALIAAGKEKAAAVITPLKEFASSGISIMNGRYGPYLKKDGRNYKIPQDKDAAALTEQECIEIISSSAPTARKKGRYSSRRR